MTDNRRRYKRLFNTGNVISVRYRTGLRFYKKDAVRVIDISGGGMKICLPEKLKTGKILDLDIKITCSNEAIKAKGEVVWSQASETKNYPKTCFETGVMFVDIDPLSISKIYTHFNEHNLEIKLT